MTLAAAAAWAPSEAVHIQVKEDFANEQIKVRVHVGKRSAVFAVYNGDVERVQGVAAVMGKVGALIQDGLAKLR
ncbi:MAG: hypothetical protein ACTHQQ_10560 [Solirubrobacteraceae bacterium]